MTFNLHFTVPIPENDDYTYWIYLMRYFLQKAEKIEIHCWNEEVEAIDEIKSGCADIVEIRKEENLTIFTLKHTDDIANFLLQNNINAEGRLKWFSIFLSSQEITLFHSEHWGIELFAPQVDGVEIQFIKSVTPSDTDFNQYK